MAKRTKIEKLPYTERQMIEYLHKENMHLEKEVAKLKKQLEATNAEASLYDSHWDEPAIGAPHGW